jgi:hypothetical protein
VVVIECGDGALAAALGEHGFDVYGVEPRAPLADEALMRGVEVRIDAGLAHVRAVPSGALGAIVLRGFVERAPLGELVEMIELAPARLASGGRLVICSLTREAWGDGATAVEAELASGRPLTPAAWEALLDQAGMAGCRTLPGGDSAFVIAADR